MFSSKKKSFNSVWLNVLVNIAFSFPRARRDCVRVTQIDKSVFSDVNRLQWAVTDSVEAHSH